MFNILRKQMDESTQCPLCRASMYWVDAEKLDEQESQSAVLKQIIEYLTDTVAITRQSIETSNPETESQEAGN